MYGQDQSDEKRQNLILLWMGFLLSFGYVGVRFLLGPVRTRLLTEVLSKELYGSLTLVVMTITFIATFSSMGAFEFLVRQTSGATADLRRGWLRVLLWRLALPGWLLIGGIGFVLNISGYWEALSLLEVTLLWLGLGATIWLLYHVFFFLACRDMWRVRVIQIVQNDLWFIGIVLAALWFSMDFRQGVLIWVGWLIILVVAVWWSMPRGKVTEPPTRPLRQVMRFGIPLLPMLASDMLFRMSDRYVILGVLDLSTVAEYTLSMNIAMMVYVAGASLLDLSLPSLYSGVQELDIKEGVQQKITEDTRRVFSVMMRHVLAVGGVAGVAMIFYHEAIFAIVSGAEFRDASTLLPWMAFIPLMMLLTMVLSRALLALNQSRFVGGAMLGAAIVNVGLNIALVPYGGAIGAALATLISVSLLCCLLAVQLRVWCWLRTSDWRPWRLSSAYLFALGGYGGLYSVLPALAAWIELLIGLLWTAIILLGLRLFHGTDFPRVSAGDHASGK